MAIELKEHLQKVSSENTPLWVDAWDYGRQLIGKGEAAAWNDIGAFVSYHRQLQGLVNSDVVMIEVGDFYQAWLKEHPGLLKSMAEKRRLGYALRTLLADGVARIQLVEIVNALCNSYSDRPIVLSVPSPRCWMGQAHCQARQLDNVEVSWDDAESAAMYMADFLRSFADCNLSGIVLQEDSNNAPSDESELKRYQPVINVAEHYRWQVVLTASAGGYLPATDTGVHYCLHEEIGKSSALKAPSDIWKGDAPLPGLSSVDFLYISVPEDAQPEKVLDVLAELRSR